jgi:hypothetical protein
MAWMQNLFNRHFTKLLFNILKPSTNYEYECANVFRVFVTHSWRVDARNWDASQFHPQRTETTSARSVRRLRAESAQPTSMH